MKNITNESENYEKNGEFYTYKNMETIVDDGTIEKYNKTGNGKKEVGLSYTKGISYNYHYETDDPKIVVPVFTIMSSLFLLIGIIILVFSIRYSNAFMIFFGISWIIMVIIFISHNLIKHGKIWYSALSKNKKDE